MSSELEVKRKACVIGWPIAHSRSPIIHSFWLNRLGITGSYEAVAVAPPDFPGFMLDLVGKGFIGANVTLPHKQKAFEFSALTTPVASRLKAVNTLWLENGALCGDNTDVEGFLGALDQEAAGWDRPGGTAIVLGAGGAARGIVYGLLLRGLKVILSNRTVARAEELAADADGNVEVAEWEKLPAALEEADLLVNTTSLGMKGQPPLDIDVSPLPTHAVVNDIVYFPLETALIRQAKMRNLRTVSGLGMLMHQAAPGFARWFGASPSVTPELRRLVEADVLKSV
ncbi:MAG: shikimate dehydrogenase [Methylocella sp.]